jgi:elongation factor Ts
MVSIDQVKQLRQETGVSITECKKALEKAQGDFEKAKEILRKWGRELAGKKSDREAGQGIIESYIHPNKKVGVLLELHCESDFVAKSDDFKTLSHELCLQIAAMNPLFIEGKLKKYKEEVSLMSQPWIKDETKTIKDLIEEYTAKLGENITVKKFARYEI